MFQTGKCNQIKNSQGHVINAKKEPDLWALQHAGWVHAQPSRASQQMGGSSKGLTQKPWQIMVIVHVHSAGEWQRVIQHASYLVPYHPMALKPSTHLCPCQDPRHPTCISPEQGTGSRSSHLILPTWKGYFTGSRPIWFLTSLRRLPMGTKPVLPTRQDIFLLRTGNYQFFPHRPTRCWMGMAFKDFQYELVGLISIASKNFQEGPTLSAAGECRQVQTRDQKAGRKRAKQG